LIGFVLERDVIWRNINFKGATIIQETIMEVCVDKHHIRGRPLYVMPLASTFLDEESMEGCIRKAVEFLKNIGGPEKARFILLGYPSRDKVFL
jgi:hypothetical protein